MTARIINSRGNVEELSDEAFYARLFGHPLTKEQRLAEHQAEVERYIALIDNGGGWSIPPAYLAECRRIIAEREAAECGPDPLRHIEPRARRVA